MELEINPKWNDSIAEMYKTQWRAYFKRGLGSPTIVYGRTLEEARGNAFAYFRKNNGNLEHWPIDRIVEKVELVG